MVQAYALNTDGRQIKTEIFLKVYDSMSLQDISWNNDTLKLSFIVSFSEVTMGPEKTSC